MTYCQVCGEDLAGDVDLVACLGCDTPHHRSCFRYVGRCSIYGCGGLTARPLAGLGPELPALHLGAETRAPSTWGPWAVGLPRRLGHRLSDLPRTLAAGVAGALLTLAAYPLFWWLVEPNFSLRRLGRMLEVVGPMALGCALLHGLIAPLLAPLQHRRPRDVALVSLVVSWSFFYFGEVARAPVDPVSAVAAAFCAALGIVFATSWAELVAGRFTRVGRRLGCWGLPVRMALTGLAFAVAMGIPCWISGILQRGAWRDVLLWSLMAAVAGGPSMEVGREEYRKKRLALEHERLAELEAGL